MTELKVLLLGWGYPPDIDGGLDVHVQKLFQNLENTNDVDVSLALPRERAPERENILPIETGEGDMGWKARKMSSRVAEIAEDYDIIHTHDWFGAEAGFKASKYSDTYWVSTLHSVSSDRSRNGNRTDELESIAVEEPDKVLTVSNRLAESIQEEHSARPEVIHNGFSKAESSGRNVKKELKIENDMIFFVGRHAEQKGIEHLLYGFKKYLESSEDAKLVIGGEGHMTDSLQEFTGLLGIEDSVLFTGFIPDKELGDFYEAADLFVSPSISEPFGLTITEALESGTPVAATSNGAEEVLSSEQIIKIESDSESIQKGIRKGLNSSPVEIEDARTWQDMTEDILKVYKSFN